MNTASIAHHVRTVLGHALTWGAIWMTLMFVIGHIVLRVDPESIDPGEEPERMAAMVGGVGALSGLIFGLLLALFERPKALANVPIVRALFWAVVAGAALPLVTSMNDRTMVNTIPFGLIAALISIGVTRSGGSSRARLSKRHSTPGVITIVLAVLGFPLPAVVNAAPDPSPLSGEWSRVEFLGDPSLDTYVTADPAGPVFYAIQTSPEGVVANTVWILDPRQDRNWRPLPTAGDPPDDPNPIIPTLFDPKRRQVVQLLSWSHHGPEGGVLCRLDVDGDRHWSRQQLTGGPPLSHFWFTLVLDVKRDRLLKFGGYSTRVAELAADVWELPLDGSSSWQWRAVVTEGQAPPAYLGASGIVDASGDRLILFGGDDGRAYQNDVWELSLVEPRRWRAVPASGEAPSPRVVSMMTLDRGGNGILVMGGTPPGTVCDAWRLRVAETAEWGRVVFPSGQAVPSGRSNAALVPGRPGEFFLAGGFHRFKSADQTVWRVTTGIPAKWNMVAGSPGPRIRSALAFDPLRERLLLFGGKGDEGPLAELWSYSIRDGAWTLEAPGDLSPSPRFGPSLTYDSARDRFLLFGGEGRSSTGAIDFPNDLWSYSPDTGEWTLVPQPGPKPTPRASHHALYDPATDRLLIVGGRVFLPASCGGLSLGRGAYREDSWTFDPEVEQWEPFASLAGVPHTEFGAALDPIHETLLTFGGARGVAICHDRNFTWRYDYREDVRRLNAGGDSLWTNVPIPGPNQVRHSADVLFDPVAEVMLSFAGWKEGQAFNHFVDVLDVGPANSGWRFLPVGAVSPPERISDHHSVFDGNDRSIWTYLGGSEVALDGTLWRLTLTGGGSSPVSKGEWSAGVEEATLRWNLDPRITTPVSIERRDPGGIWRGIFRSAPATGGALEFTDKSLAPARSYEYRLVYDLHRVRMTGGQGEVATLAPMATRLLAAWPNPTPGAFRVRFDLSEPGAFSVEYFDVAGRRVGQDGPFEMAPGRHEMGLSAPNQLSSGRYFLRLQAGRETITVPLILVR